MLASEKELFTLSTEMENRKKKIKCELYRDKKKPPIRRQFPQDTL